MKPLTYQEAGLEIVDALADLFECPPPTIELHSAPASAGYDYYIALAGHRFCVEYKRQAAAGHLACAINQLTQAVATRAEGGVPLMAVPHMGRLGQKLCSDAGVSWMDLSGNANIICPGLRIKIAGRPNRFPERGRPSNPFAAKSARVARQLLLEPERYQAQAELSRRTGLGDGYISKIVRRLAAEHYLDADAAGAVRPRDPNLLLDAWHSAYRFDRHRRLVGQVTGTGVEVSGRIANHLLRAKISYAATGLGAAWLYTNFADFQLATFYLELAMPSRALLREIGFIETPDSANVWFVVADDGGVFHGAEQRRGVRCVSPLQTYLDLKGHPAPASAAAIEMRRKHLA